MAQDKSALSEKLNDKLRAVVAEALTSSDHDGSEVADLVHDMALQLTFLCAVVASGDKDGTMHTVNQVSKSMETWANTPDILGRGRLARISMEMLSKLSQKEADISVKH